MQSCITGSQRVRRACRCYERVEHTQYVINVHGNVGVRKGPADSLGREPLLEGSPGDGLLSLLAPFSSLSSTCSPGACSSPRGKPRRPGSCALDSQVPGVCDIRGCGCAPYSRGMGMPGPRSEGSLPRSDVRELWEPGLTGHTSPPSHHPDS